MAVDNWTAWSDIHQEPDQIKRMKSAERAACTPISLDVALQSGVFSGSKGVYETSLLACPCRDFAIRRKPCKHMYRLAMEIGAHSGNFKSDATKVLAPLPKDSYSLSEMVQLLESLPTESQILFKEYILARLYGDRIDVAAYPRNNNAKALLDSGLFQISDLMPGYYHHTIDLLKFLHENDISGFGKKRIRDSLQKWCLENADQIAPIVHKKLYVLNVSPRCVKSLRKTYIYLMRKFDVMEYFDEHMQRRYIPKGAEDSLTWTLHADGSMSHGILTLAFPDDEITSLLNKYGANRCDNWER